MKTLRPIFAIFFFTAIALAQPFTPQPTTVQFIKGTAELEVHAYVVSQDGSLKYDRVLTGLEAVAVMAGDLDFPTAAVSKDANAQWSSQATAALVASQPPAPPVVLSTAKGDPAQADSTIAAYTASTLTIQAGVQALIQQATTKLPIATQLQLFQQIQSLVQAALPK